MHWFSYMVSIYLIDLNCLCSKRNYLRELSSAPLAAILINPVTWINFVKLTNFVKITNVNMELASRITLYL